MADEFWRTRSHFAWLPVRLDDGRWAWLRTVKATPRWGGMSVYSTPIMWTFRDG